MMMKYFYLSQYPGVFLKMTGLRVKEFDQLVKDVMPLFKASEEQRLDRPDRQRDLGGGRKARLDARDQILLTVIWLRLYPTQDILGYFFGISQSAVSHVIAHVLPVLEQAGRDTMRMPDPGRKRRKTLDQLLEELPEVLVVIDIDVQIMFWNNVMIAKPHPRPLPASREGRSAGEVQGFVQNVF